MDSILIQIIQMCCIIISAISISCDVLLNIVYPVLLILGLGAIKMVSTTITDIFDAQEIHQAFKDRMESDAKKDDLIHKLQKDMEAEMNATKGMQAIGDAATRAIQRQLHAKREELKLALDRINSLESKAQARRTRRSERLLERDGVFSVLGGGQRWGTDSASASTSRGR